MTGRIATLLFGAALATAHLTASAGVIVLDFEGIPDGAPIGEYYNGSGGPSYGVSFSAGALAIIDSDAGGVGNFANEPSPDTVMYFFYSDNAVLNMVSGFTVGFSFYYSASEEASVSVYDGINATGNLLAVLRLGKSDQSCTGDPNMDGYNCNWTPIGMSFPGIGRSIDFGGTRNRVAFDNITFGSATPGSGNGTVPEPASLALFGLGLAGIAATCRARPACAPLT